MNLVRMYLICNVFSFRLLSFNVSLTVEGIVALKRLVLQSDKLIGLEGYVVVCNLPFV